MNFIKFDQDLNGIEISVNCDDSGIGIVRSLLIDLVQGNNIRGLDFADIESKIVPSVNTLVVYEFVQPFIPAELQDKVMGSQAILYGIYGSFSDGVLDMHLVESIERVLKNNSSCCIGSPIQDETAKKLRIVLLKN